MPEVPPRDNFAFVMNVSRLVGADAFTLVAGHQLRRATAQEIAIIEQNMSGLVPTLPYLLRNPWKTKLENAKVHVLPPDEWRFFVIAFSGTNEKMVELEQAFVLAPGEIKVAFTCVGFPGIPDGLPGAIWHPDRLLHALPASIGEQLAFIDIQAADIDEIADIHSRLQRSNSGSLDIKRYANELQSLQGLPQRSPLLFLGYFALLESLLTHAPDPKDPLDSITRQVKSKISLLNNRFKHPVDYTRCGAGNPETIWTKMYDYRSRLAHGDTPDFNARLAVLQDHQTALELLRETVKAALRHALVEPQLIADLRNC